MTAQYPEIEVVQQSRPTKGRSGLLNNIAIIGAFDTTVADPQLFGDLTEAQTALGTDNTYNGCKVLPIIFTSGTCLAVNITTESEGTRDKTLTTAKLSAALAKIKGEDFDICHVALDVDAGFFLEFVNEEVYDDVVKIFTAQKSIAVC